MVLFAEGPTGRLRNTAWLSGYPGLLKDVWTPGPRGSGEASANKRQGVRTCEHVSRGVLEAGVEDVLTARGHRSPPTQPCSSKLPSKPRETAGRALWDTGTKASVHTRCGIPWTPQDSGPVPVRTPAPPQQLLGQGEAGARPRPAGTPTHGRLSGFGADVPSQGHDLVAARITCLWQRPGSPMRPALSRTCGPD